MSIIACKIRNFVGLSLLTFVVMTGAVWATPYGSGSYGACKYSDGCDTVAPGTSPTSKPKTPSSRSSASPSAPTDQPTESPSQTTPSASNNTTPPTFNSDDTSQESTDEEPKSGIFASTSSKIIAGSLLLGAVGIIGWFLWFIFKRRRRDGSISENIVPPGGYK